MAHETHRYVITHPNEKLNAQATVVFAGEAPNVALIDSAETDAMDVLTEVLDRFPNADRVRVTIAL